MEVQEIDLSPVVGSAANSLNLISNEGVLGAVTVLCICFAAVAGYILIRQATMCFKGTKQSLDNNTDMIREFKDDMKDALHGIQLTLAKRDSKGNN